MARKVIIVKDKEYACPICNYTWEDESDLEFDEDERVLCCPECKELIEDGENGGEYV